MARGRPIKSAVRQNIIELLHYMKQGYGYDIYKNYVKIFPKTTMRNVYYHLKKGVVLGELEEKEVKLEDGNYSWGETAKKIYYKIGKKAKVKGNKKVKEWFEKR